MSKIDQTQGRASGAIDRAPAPRNRGCEMTFETEGRDRRGMRSHDHLGDAKMLKKGASLRRI